MIKMTALEFLKQIKFLPMSTENPCTKATKSEIKRWLKKKSVVINNIRPLPSDEINFPIINLVFFPKGKRKCTMR